MATTTNLLATLIEVSQSQKETTANAAFNIFDTAIAGSISKAITSADVTLSDNEARAAIISLSGVLTGNRNLIVPTRTKIYLVYNGTSGSFSVTVKTAAGTGVTVEQGSRAFVYCDGVNVVAQTVTAPSLSFKDAVRATTTTNITLSGAQTIDGVSVIAGDRVLVKDQSTAADNGIYVAASGAWSRATDFDASSEVKGGCVIPVSEGTANGNLLWMLTTNDPITVGATSLSFAILQTYTAGLNSFKAAVRVATTIAGTLATSFENGDTVDGVTLATSDRILIKNQASAAENGIYVVAASGAPTRATDFDADNEATPGCVIPVNEGTANGKTLWMLTVNPPVTLNSTALNFAQLAAGTPDHNHTGGGDGGDLSGAVVSNYLDLAEVAAPSTPPSGYARLYVKSDGLFYGKDDAGVETALSGGGGGGGSNLTAPPVLSNWTWVNQGDATAADSSDIFVGAMKVTGITLVAPANAGPNIRALVKSAPSPGYTITMAYLPTILNSNFYEAGFCWRQLSTQEFVLVGNRINSAVLNVGATKWDDHDTFNLSYNVGFQTAYAGLHWLRLTDDNTNRIIQISADGVNWVTLHTIGRTDFLTADQVGFFVRVQNASFGAALSLVHWVQS